MVETTENNAGQKVKSTRKLDSILTLLAMLSILAAWIIGTRRSMQDLQPYLQQVLPEADRFTHISGQRYEAYQGREMLGYVTIRTANGYGGPMDVAVAVDLQGKVLGATVIAHKETPSFFERVRRTEWIESLFGKSFDERFVIGEDIDGVSGATYTSRAIADAVRRGSQEIALLELGEDLPEEPKPEIQFGIPEITLLALYAVGFVGHRHKFKYTRQARWFSMITGLIVLGFIYNSPLTIAVLNKFLLGYWPQWQTNLYWYFLVGGILIVLLIDNKNPYCDWFCPFGAAQECLGALGGAKVRTPTRYRTLLTWVPRGLAWLAIVLALLYRSPGISSYEVFGALFAFLGSNFQFALLSIILIASLFFRRPWCHFLCPLRPVVDLIREMRKWVIIRWNTITRKKIISGTS